MTRLRDATGPARDDRELVAGALTTGRVTRADYVLLLFGLYGFHAPVERGLSQSPQLAAVVPDAGLRNHKAALLAADLVALGTDRRQLAALPRMTFPARLALPEALGWTYVVESMTVGGKQLARRLARQLPGEIHTASAYLACYGDDAGQRWRELGIAIDGFVHAERDGDRAIEAARDGFSRLRAWIAPRPTPARILA